MANEAKIKETIYRAIRTDHNTHGRQAPGDRQQISNEESEIIRDAVFDALHKAEMLDLG